MFGMGPDTVIQKDAKMRILVPCTASLYRSQVFPDKEKINGGHVDYRFSTNWGE